MIAACNATIIDNNKRLKNLEHVFGASTSQDTTENDDNFIMQFFPLSTIQAIRDMEYMLTSTEEAVIHFRKFLLKIGGNNPKNNIQRILKNVFTNECVVDCSWKGKRDNFKICDLKLIKIMKRDVISRYVTLTEAEFENIVAEWLRFAKQRQERDKNKRNVELEEHYV
ncbi:PREDICTED: uncharacterized protein LOC105452368 [Wasmannia auropunctata]|uniref:uncharacterized protein LOC105452368 n=1 Tax=Wasmannia auropunctata TaxID=64793 RepID=UPI0005EF24E3|nr:PREDICTED: uncharacterized protein LOC105452368 [Wasmannia auropunctata]